MKKSLRARYEKERNVGGYIEWLEKEIVRPEDEIENQRRDIAEG